MLIILYMASEQGQVQSVDARHVSMRLQDVTSARSAICRQGLLSSLAGTYYVYLSPTSTIFHDPRWTVTCLSPTTLPPLMTMRLSFRLWLRLCTLAHLFMLLGNNSVSPPPPSPIACIVANLCLSLMKASSCSTTHRRPPSWTGANSKLTWSPRCHV